MRKIIYLMTIVLGAAGILVIGLFIRIQSQVKKLDAGLDDIRIYQKHYLFISSDESQMLRDIYEQTALACEDCGAWLEWCGQDMPGHYSAAECVGLSIAMEADGIIVYPDGSQDLEEAIRKASGQGIPVVTILRDLPDSGRVSFVGVSNYQMGDRYGGQLLSLMHNGKNAVCLLTDKEEIGSVGATGAASYFFENAVAEILNAMGVTGNLAVRRALAHSRMISSDVSAGYDPIYPGVNEAKNSAYLGHGICFNKFTGARGKSGSNDANAEYVAVIRRIMDDNKVNYQTSELGKVDQGGGGTIAYISAKYGMEVIDAGVPVLSMHAPWEVVSKADVFEAVKAYKAFLKDA